jgi:BirA family transcriptional regulator, biotin operon repressor / biotin---[acetyl-CoA-carboxylase] ligase
MIIWPFVRTVIQRDTAESTSDLAHALIDDATTPLPLAVWAARQTRGRSRGSNLWWSDAGSLTFTIALDPAAHSLRPEHEPRLALAAAVAVIDAIGSANLTEPLGIRWPNDIEAGDRKLGGILPERVLTPGGPRLLIGIGLNVLTEMGHAPPEVRRMAASLAELRITATPPGEVERILRAVLAGFPETLDKLARDNPELPERWAELDTLRDQAVSVDLGPRIVTGVGRGIGPEGGLCLATEEGLVRLSGGRVLRP